MKKQFVILLIICSVLILYGNLYSIGTNKIFDVIKTKKLSDLKKMIRNNKSLINVVDAKKNTLLHNAAFYGKKDIIEYLIQKGADINAVNIQLNTPLHQSIINGKDKVSKLLIQKGSDLSKKNIVKKTPLHLSVRYNRDAIVRFLISKGADINCIDGHNRTPLSLAARETGNVKIAKILIKNGADINVMDTNKQTPLVFATWKGFTGIINILLDKGAGYSKFRNGAYHLLADAARAGSVRLFNYVVKKEGDNIFYISKWNEYFMNCAINGGSLKIIKMLKNRKIPINIKPDIYGNTVLHYASERNKFSIIKFLKENGVDINKRNNLGESAYNIADKKGHKNMQKMILSFGGNSEPQKFQILKSPYLGQSPPKNRGEIFAPGIVFSEHSSVTITPDFKEMYWQLNSSIKTMKLKNGIWTKPENASFSTDSARKHMDDVPFISPDNKKLFFVSKRPIDKISNNKENIWYVNRTSNGWSKPKPVNSEINGMSLHWQISVSSYGTLFFGGSRGEDGYGKNDIYYSKFVNDRYTKPLNIGPIINSKEGEFSPFIAPDESYLIFSRTYRGRGRLFISFKLKNKKWSQSFCIERYTRGGINGIVSPDNKYLFYLENDSIKWVSAEFINTLKKKMKN